MNFGRDCFNKVSCDLQNTMRLQHIQLVCAVQVKGDVLAAVTYHFKMCSWIPKVIDTKVGFTLAIIS